jgi:hypothetical protein
MTTENPADNFSNSIQITWRDEREAVALVHNPQQLAALLRSCAIDHPPELPLQAENAQLALQSLTAEFPVLITITRKPQDEVQRIAWGLADAGVVRIIEQDGEPGLFFVEGEIFVPFSRLDYDPGSGGLTLRG